MNVPGGADRHGRSPHPPLNEARGATNAKTATATDTEAASPHIGTLAEKSLHAQLKDWYGRPGDVMECRVDGFVVDIVRGDLLIEIQTANFSAMRRKLDRLLDQHRVHLLHPLCTERWIVKVEGRGNTVTSRRKSPHRGNILDLFYELVHLPRQLAHPNLTLEVALTREEELRRADKRRWRNHGWSRLDRQLLEVRETRTFRGPEDYLALLPEKLPIGFTTADLAEALGRSRPFAQKMAYTLRHMGALEVIHKQRQSLVYARAL